MPLVLWWNSYQCVSYLGLFCIRDLKYWMSWIIITMVAYSMSNIWYTLLVCMCLYCVSWWCCLGTGHLSGSLSLTAQDYMLDWLGGVTSTVSFCQLSGGVCYPTNLCMNCRLCMGLYWTYDVCKLCILYRFWMIFVLIFCLCFMYKFHSYIKL